MHPWYVYLLAFRKAPDHQTDWIKVLTEPRYPMYCRFDPDGFIYREKDHAIGQYRFVSCEEVGNAFPDVPGKAKSQCPYVEEVQGYLNFEFWEQYPPLEERIELVSQWLYLSYGWLVRMDTGQHIDAIVQKSFPLNDCISKWGFEDGDFFLDKKGAYTDDVWAGIRAVLHQLGLKPVIQPFGTSHNPFRIQQLEHPKHAWEIFRKHSHDRLLTFWGYHLEAIEGTPLPELLKDEFIPE